MSVDDLVKALYAARAQGVEVYNTKARQIDEYGQRLQADMTQDSLEEILRTYPAVKYVFMLTGYVHMEEIKLRAGIPDAPAAVAVTGLSENANMLTETVLGNV